MKPGYPSKRATEQEGRKILRRLFTEAGYQISEDYLFDESGVKVHLDGWDPQHRVGYAYLTKEGHDKDEIRDAEIGKLVQRMEHGELHLLMIDGDGNPDAEILEYLADNFLKELHGGDETRPGEEGNDNETRPGKSKSGK